jgi:CrcB protein
MNWLYVFLGGGFGSLARYGMGLFVPQLVKTSFPLATFLSNTLACLVLGAMVYFSQKGIRTEWMNHLVIVGFCGGFSTFSTFSNDNLQLIQNGNWMMATFNVILSVITGIAAIYFTSTFKN